MNCSNRIWLVMALMSVSGTVLADAAGRVQFVSGEVQLINAAGQARVIQKGDAVSEGDMLVSAKGATAQIRMQDGGIIALRPDTRIKFDRFSYAGQQDGSEHSFTSLLKGGFRAITGAIGQVNKSSYRITTPTSTIGIRGTDHETVVVLADSGLAAPTGTYNRVNAGETSITTDRGTIAVRPNQMGFAGSADALPMLQPVNPALFTAVPSAGQSSNGNAPGRAVRENAVVDEPAGNTSNTGGGGSSSGNSGSSGSSGGSETTSPVLVQASGQTINLNNQTTTTSGTTTPLQTNTPVVVQTAAYVQNDLAVAFATSSSNYLQSFTEIGALIAAPNDVNNALPNPSFVDRYVGHDAASFVTYTLNGTTVVGQAASTLANGIQFGRYNSTASQKVVVGNTSCCTAGTYPSPGAVYSHWITGPAVSPVYLPEALSGAVNYTFAGGTTPTASFIGSAATLNAAALSVNFSQQRVAFSLSLNVGATPWTAAASGVPLESLYWNSARVGFRASTAARSGWALLNVTGATSGDVTGQLTGNALNGAIMSYVLSGTSNQVAGVAAFTGAALNTATPYRIAALSTTGMIPAGQPNAGQVVPTTAGAYNNSANVLFDGAGNLTQFNSTLPMSNGGGLNSISQGTAAAVGLGSDAVSGISWGRWQGGAITTTDLSTTVASSHANTSSSHWITGPVMTAPVDLPVSGSYTYVLAGGTAPTDSLGGVGTLNSASLSANFSAQTVTVGVNVTTPNAGNLVATGANIPIEQKNFFNASTANAPNGGSNQGLLTVTCAAGCGAGGAISGNVGGVFVGTGGIGAGMAYGLSNGTVNVNGVAAFHR